MRRPVAAISIFGALTIACTGTGHYFGEVEAVIDRMRTDSIAATPRAGAVSRAAVIEVNEVRRTAVEALEAMDPPIDAAPEHRALTAALTDLVMATNTFVAAHTGEDPATFEAAVLSAADLQALAGRVGLACNALQTRAAALGSDVVIRC